MRLRWAAVGALAALALVWSAAAQHPPQEEISFEGLDNLALNKPTWTNGGIGQGDPTMLTDGEIDSLQYLGGPTRVGIDFEETTMLNGIHIWHFWLTNPTYTQNIIGFTASTSFLELGVTDDPKEVNQESLDAVADFTTVWNSKAGDPEYVESEAGWKIVFEPLEAQYLHAWIGRNNVNQFSHWVEIKAYFNPALLSVDPEGKAAATWGGLKAR